MIWQAHRLLDMVTADMDAYYEERTETWKDSERGEAFTERLESLQEIITLLRELP